MSSSSSPRILLGFVINNGRVLVSRQQDSQSDFQVDFSDILEKIKLYSETLVIIGKTQKFTISEEQSGRSLVHGIFEDGNLFGCVSHRDVSLNISFLFLSKVRDEMFEQPSLISRSCQATEHEFDRDFGPVLAQLMDDFNKGRVDDKLMVVQNQIHDVKEILLHNMEEIFRRGELLDDLLNKTESLDSQGRRFHQQARALEIRVWWKNVRLWVVICVIASVFVIVAILYFAKIFDKKK